MENPSPPRHPRLAWLALAAFGTLLLLPATRYLLRTQFQMEPLTYSTEPNLPAERAAAAHLPDDYAVQLALAVQLPTTFANADAADPLAQAKARNLRLEALTRRFASNSSSYANLLRYMTSGDVQIHRSDDYNFVSDPDAGKNASPPPSPESLAMFDAAAQKGAEFDPDNAYFPMMRAVGLLSAHRDREALESFQTAARCSRWTEYYQDEVNGQNRLQRAAYGEQNAIRQMNNAAALPFPHYAQLRNAARVATHLTADQEAAGNAEEGIAVRHALICRTAHRPLALPARTGGDRCRTRPARRGPSDGSGALPGIRRLAFADCLCRIDHQDLHREDNAW